MSTSRIRFSISFSLLTLLIGVDARLLRAADHRESPALANSAIVGARDINDIYVFRSPTNPQNTVMILTTNPFAGALSPTTFEPRLFYRFKIDQNGDAEEDIALRLQFFRPHQHTGRQLYVLWREAASGGRLSTTELLAVGVTGTNVPFLGGPSEGRVRAAVQDDPFFFDGVAFSDFIEDGIPGSDGFPRRPGVASNLFGPAPGSTGGPNVLAITIELPSSLLTDKSSQIGLWCTTEIRRGWITSSRFDVVGRTLPFLEELARQFQNTVQVDRMGRPAIASALIPPVPRNSSNQFDRRDEFNATRPVHDRRDFLDDVISILMSFYGRSETEAAGIANVLLPDILTFDTSNPEGFLNGRRLADDVIDLELSILTGGAVGTDNVPNDSTFQNDFPYIGKANRNPLGPNPN